MFREDSIQGELVSLSYRKRSPLHPFPKTSIVSELLTAIDLDLPINVILYMHDFMDWIGIFLALLHIHLESSFIQTYYHHQHYTEPSIKECYA